MNPLKRLLLSPSLACNVAITLVCAFAVTFALPTYATAKDDLEPRVEDLEFFESKIRPVLVEHCYECHSTAAAENDKLRGGLRLDSKVATLEGGDTGPALVPGKPDESLLLAAMNYEEFEMPPSGKLDEQILRDFATWIERGAADPRLNNTAIDNRQIDLEAGRNHWAFQPLSSPKPPVGTAWSRSDIDRFIEAKLSSAGVTGNADATPRVLVRRVWFDLLGLPPSPAELMFWTNALSTDVAKGASINVVKYKELVDTLLASPRYGERWARHWMDVSRFAESHGYEQDYDRPHAYHYRDFLIRAFNDNLPYDQFLSWQLAGDELAPDNPLAQMATGFLGAGVFPTQLTEAEFESARYDELDDMVATTGVAFLGLSLGCARCHDHKFDPIPTKDYYRFAANFTTTIRGELELDLDPVGNAKLIAAFDERTKELQNELRQFETNELPEAFVSYLADTDLDGLARSPWTPLLGELNSTAKTKYVQLPSGSYLATGPAPPQETLTFTASLPTDAPTSLRLEALQHESLPGHGPGRADNGNFALCDIRIFVLHDSESSPEETADRVAIGNPRATHQQNENSLSIAASLDDDPISGWAVDGQIGKSQAAIFEFAEPDMLRAGDKLRIEMQFTHPNRKHVMGHLRLSVSSDAAPPLEVGQQGMPVSTLAALKSVKQSGKRTGEAWKTGINWYKSQSPDWQRYNKALQQHQSSARPSVLSKVMVSSEGLPKLSHHGDGRGFPHFYPEVHLLRRGDVEQKVEPVDAGFVQVLSPSDAAFDDWMVEAPDSDWRTSMRRARLTRWMTDVDEGAGALVARVMVNRLWLHHFGKGIVETPNDFGNSGESPSHPELLEWLAHRFVDSGWDIKAMHRQIMTSKTYMQSGSRDDARDSIDPDNRLYWRRTARRLEAEAIRDSMLSVSGQLDLTMYGPGSLDPKMKRRSIYFFIKRSQLIPMMMLFDWPEHQVSIGRRVSTTIAPQALMFMNSPEGRGMAQALVQDIDADTREARLKQLFMRCFSREPTHSEIELSVQFIDQQTSAYKQVNAPQPDQAAWTDLGQSLLSSSEFIYID